MRLKFLGICATALLLCSSVVSAGDVVRVALLHTNSGPRLDQIVAAAEAELGQRSDIQLLERQEIGRLLDEQKLSLSGLVDAESAIKVGRTLSSQVLVSVEQPEKSPVISLVVFDASTGVRLWDQAVTSDQDNEAAGTIVRGVAAALLKRQHADRLRTLCLMAVRNADLPRGMDGFCDAVGRLLERNLVRSPSVSLLERSRLEQVTRERVLADDPARKQLLASLTVVNLDIERDGEGLRATALLTDSAGKSLGKETATAREGDAAGLAAALAAALSRDEKLRPAAGQMDLRTEAARFAAEAEFRISHTDPLRAIPAVEAAHALDPGNLAYHALRAQALIQSARMIDYGHPPGSFIGATPLPPPEDAAALAARGADSLADSRRLFDQSDPASQGIARPILNEAADELCNYLVWASLVRINRAYVPTVQSAEYSAARAGLRRYLLDDDARLLLAIHDQKSFDEYSRHLVSLLGDAEWVYAGSAEEWAEEMRAVGARWLELHEKYRSDCSASVTAALEAMTVGWGFERHPYVHIYLGKPGLLRWGLSPAAATRLDSLREKINQSREPVMQRFNDIFALTISVARVQDKPDLMEEQVGAYLEQAKRQLAAPQLKDKPDMRALLYHLMIQADMLLDKTSWDGHFSRELFDFMLARHEVYFPVVQGRTGRHYTYPISAAYKAEAIAANQRIIAVLDLPDVQVFPPQDKQSVRSGCLGTIQLFTQPLDEYLHVSATRPWTEQRQLLDVFDAKDSLQWVLAPIVRQKVAYAVGVERHGEQGPGSLELLTIPLDGSPIHTGARLPVELNMSKSDAFLRDSARTTLVSASCVDGGSYFAAVERQGIYIFPLDRGNARRLEEKDGLPSLAARSLTSLDGKLYAGLGLDMKDGYLVSYDMGSRRIDVIAASQRKDKRSPFDDGAPFEMHQLVADPPRHRLLVMVYLNEAEPKLSGLWEYKPAGDQWRQLVPMRPPKPPQTSFKYIFSSNPIEFVGPITGSRFPVATMEGIFLFDVETDRAERLYERTRRNFEPPFPIEMTRYAPETDAGEHALTNRRGFNFLCVLDGDWLWDGAAGPWGRANLMTGERQQFLPVRDNGDRFVAYVIQPLDEGHVLVGDQFGLWVLKFPDGNPK